MSVPVAIILVFWKKKGIYEGYTSVKGFCEYHPQYKAERIYNGAFRKKVNYEDEDIVLSRVPCYGRAKKK